MVKNPPANAGDLRDAGLTPGLARRAWQPTPVFLPGEAHRQMSLVGHGPCGHRESDKTGVTKHAQRLVRENDLKLITAQYFKIFVEIISTKDFLKN